MRSRLFVFTLLAIVLGVFAAYAGVLQVWPKIDGLPNYHIGLPHDVYGVHPIDRESYGEGYFFLGSYNDGSYSFANVFITNLGPGDQNANVDISVVEPNGKNYFAKTDFDGTKPQAATDHMDVRVGDSRIWGRHPNFNVKLKAKQLALNLKYQATLPGFAINSGRVLYGSNEDFYSSYILQPRAKISGSITTPSGTRQVNGYGYNDHGWVTMMPHKYSKRWFSLRCFDEKYTLDILEFTVPSEWGSKKVPMIIFARDNKILYGGTRYSLKPSQWQTDPQSGLKWPKRFEYSIDRPGRVKVTGTYTVERLLEKIDLLSTLSFLERQVARFFAKSYIYRFIVKVEGTVTLPDGTTDTFASPAISEVLYIL